jgi:hypothetical protein
MFVAKVHGDAMAPAVPPNSYCVFRPPVDGEDLAGQITFVRHAKIDDPHTGGDWTVRRYTTQTPSTGDEWKHTRVTLQAESHDAPPIAVDSESPGDVMCLGVFVGAIIGSKEGK